VSSMNRRDFGLRLTAGLIGVSSAAQAQNLSATEHMATEWSLTSAKKYKDPFGDIELDVVLQGPAGTQYRAPAFWSGDYAWRVRFAPPTVGR